MVTKRNSDGTVEISFSLAGYESVKAYISADKEVRFEGISLENLKAINLQFYYHVMVQTLRALSKVSEVVKVEGE